MHNEPFVFVCVRVCVCICVCKALLFTVQLKHLREGGRETFSCMHFCSVRLSIQHQRHPQMWTHGRKTATEASYGVLVK